MTARKALIIGWHIGLILALFGTVACTSMTPHAPRKGDLIGDKVWHKLNPYFKPEWKGWIKAAYWFGPGH